MKRSLFHGKSLRWVWLAALLPGWLWAASQGTLSPPSTAATDVYVAQTIWTGKKTINHGYLIVEGGKVKEVGEMRNHQPAYPAHAKVHPLGKAFLMPGLIAAETSLAERGRDDVQTLTPEVRALDGFNFYEDYQPLLAGGVTTVQVAPGTRRLMPGQGAVVQTAGSDPERRTLKDRESLRILLGSAYRNAPRIYEPPIGAVSFDKPLDPTKPQLGSSLASVVAGLRAAFQAAGQPGGPLPGDLSESALDVIAEYMKPGKTIRITTPTVADMRAALALAREFNLKLILVDPGDLRPFRTSLEQWKDVVIGVILQPDARAGAIQEVPVPEEDAPKPMTSQEKARWLLDAGIPVALRPQQDADLKDLLYLASSYRTSLSVDESLSLVTRHAAHLLGLGDRVGTLEPGQQADFVVLSGPPFAARSRIDQVFIAGENVYSAANANLPKAVKSKPLPMLLKARQIYTGDGQRIEQGQMLIHGSTIRGVGRSVSASLDCPVHDFGQAVIVPGFFDMGAKLGLGGAPQGNATLGTKLGEYLLTSDPQVRLARQGGVTSVLLSIEQAGPSPVVAFKLSDRPQVLKDPAAIRFQVSGNLTMTGQTLRDALRSGKAYADAWTQYERDNEEYQKKLAEYNALKAKLPASKPEEKKPEENKTEEKKPDEKATEEKKPEEKKPEEKKPAEGSTAPAKGPSESLPPEPKAPQKPQLVEVLEPYRSLFAGKMPALVEARRLDQIQLAVTIFRDEFNVRTVLVGADDAHRMETALAEKDVSVIAGPEFIRTVDRETIHLPLRLANAGIPFAFQSQAATGVQQLPSALRYAVRQGLGADDALSGLTTTPAQLLGLDQRIGVLAAGKDADLVVLSGPPFDAATRVIAVMIDGQWVHSMEDDR